ncbi:MAG: DUF4342 domain-containing protein [bacterium]
MTIDLAKIDLIRERTGLSYRQAKELLESTGGDVVEALIMAESKDKSWQEEIQVKGNELAEKIREIIHKGNVTKLKVKNGDQTIVEIPVTAGAIGAIIVPKLAALGAIAALLTKCTIEIERTPPNPEQSEGEMNVE